MGIKGAHTYTHSITGVTVGELYQIALSRRVINQQSTISSSSNDNIEPILLPTIDIDASWVYRSSTITIDNRMSWMMNMGIELAKVGFIVVFVCDGSVRHHTKRATVDRISKSQKVTIDGYLKRTELMALAERRLECVCIDEKQIILQQESVLSKKIKAIEKQQQTNKVNIGDEFFNTIKDYIADSIPETIGVRNGKITVIKAFFQADSVIAFRCINRISDIVMSSDSDLAALAGRQCISIKSFKFNEKSKEDKLMNMIIYTPSYITLMEVTKSIFLSSNSIRIIKSDFPIFDNIDCIKIRGLLAVGLGCDVFLSGVYNIGKVKIRNYIEKEIDVSYENIMQFYCESLSKSFNSKKITKDIVHNDMNDGSDNKDVNDSLIFHQNEFVDAINIFVESFIYEPGNYTTHEIFDDKALFMTYEKPIKLHEYCEAFAYNDNEISIYKSINTLLNCKGSGAGSHIFLSYENQYSCMFCKQILCKYCYIDGTENKYCYDCYLSEITVVPINVMNQPTIVNMRKKLLDIGVETFVEDNVNDVADLYDAIVEKKELFIYTKEKFENIITIPLYCSTYLESEKIIFRFDLKNGGSFIRHSSCLLKHKIDIINLFGKLVQNGGTSNDLYKLSNNKFYTVLPDIIVNFAERSRLHSGYRLLKRAVRHSMDADGCSILSSNCCIIEHNNCTGIHIQHNVKASMKATIYIVKVSFTSQDILAVSCTCKAGSVNDEKVLCVHILPVILQLSLLLFDGLAEHSLYELANEFNQTIEESLSKETKNDLIQSILLLKRANSEIVIEDNNDKLNINELLSNYKVGTEQFKRGPGPPKDNNKLGPLRLLSFNSPLLLADSIINKKILKNISYNEKPKAILPIDNYIPYNLILNLIKFVHKYFNVNSTNNTVFEDCIGYKLLSYRANFNYEYNKIEYIDKKKQLLEAFNLSNCIYRTQFTSATDDYLSCIVIENDKNNNNVIDNEVQNFDNNNVVTPKNILPKNRYTCCACNVTSTKFPNATFSIVPKIPTKKTRTDNMLLTYYHKKFKRQEWMRRLGISIYNKNNFLKICNNHVIENQLTTFKWKNILNEEELTTTKILLPINVNDPPIRTRNEHNKRESVSNNESQRIKRKKKNIINDVPRKKINKRFCCYVGCRVSNKNTNNVSFSSIPKDPPILKKNAKNSQILQYATRLEYKKEYLKSIGIDQKDKRKDLRICNQHKSISFSTIIQWKKTNEKMESTKITFDLPAIQSEKIDEKNKAREAKGLGRDRFLCNTINEVKQKIITEKNEAAMWAYSMQQSCAMNDSPLKVHHTVAKAVGIDIHQQSKNKYKICKEVKEKEKVIIRMDNMTDKQIKSQTGFESLASLISYIIILCNGDIKKMTTTNSKLTWFEEWMLYFEKAYSRSISRWREYEDKYKRTGAVLRHIFDIKLNIAIICRQQWPMYVTVTEDEVLRDIKWNENYEGKRVVMWDNTCIRLPQPLDPEAQRNTYSAYYAGNVGKGAIFVQLCGWIGTYEIWMGAVSDSDYFVRSGILKQQEEYIPIHDASNAHIKWVNILDKGYRVTSAAWRTGKQFVLQPSFAKSDKKFSTIETLRSAAIASDRGANERAVRLSKLSGQLHNGKTGNQSIERLSDLWLTWSFQCNYMYKPVL